MKFTKAFIVASACSFLALVSGCVTDQYDEDGVDYDRAGRVGYTRVTFTLVRADAPSEALPTVHHLYLDQTVSVPRAAAGGPLYTHVPEDRGGLGYRIESVRGATRLDIVDLDKLTPEGTPTQLYRMSCVADERNAAVWTSFDSPNRADDGSFVRIQMVDERSAVCGVGEIK